jgi:predicted HicB family RNase H-like nuclease
MIPDQYQTNSIQEGGISMWKKKKVKPKQMAVNVSEETRKRIEEEAEAEDISVSAWIGRAIEKYFEWENKTRKEQVS